MKKLALILGGGLALAAAAFMLLTTLVVLFSFAEWEWVGYNWKLVRLTLATAFLAGTVMTTVVVLDER